MNRDTIAETIIGAIVVLVAVGFLAYALMSGGGHGVQSGAYTVTASFNKVDGVKVGSDVRLAGVKVGSVSSVGLNKNDPVNLARLTLAIDPAVDVPNDSVAKVTSDGLLGGAYVSLDPGAGDPLKHDGKAVIEQTAGSVDLLTTLVNAVSGMNSNKDNAAAKDTLKP